jgi:hypothetical protein
MAEVTESLLELLVTADAVAEPPGPPAPALPPDAPFPPAPPCPPDAVAVLVESPGVVVVAVASPPRPPTPPAGSWLEPSVPVAPSDPFTTTTPANDDDAGAAQIAKAMRSRCGQLIFIDRRIIHLPRFPLMDA